MTDKQKQIILVAVGFGVVGTVAYFGLGISLASLSIGLYSASLFAFAYFSIMTDVVIAGGMVNSAKSIYSIHYCDTFAKKHPQAFSLYNDLFQKKELLLKAIANQEQLSYSAKAVQYRALLKQQKNYNQMLKTVDDLPSDEKKSFLKYATLKGSLETMDYKDATLEKQMKQPKTKQPLATPSKTANKIKTAVIELEQTQNEPKEKPLVMQSQKDL